MSKSKFYVAVLALLLALSFSPKPQFVQAQSKVASKLWTPAVQSLAWPGPRTTAPHEDNAYFFADNPYYQTGYGLPNCTCYAFGRAYELLGSRPKLTEGNADDFWPDNLASGAYAYGSEAKLGAIACWDEGWYGHVGVVELIEEERILISESNWDGREFCTRWVPKQSEDLQGYIYIADFNIPSRSAAQAYEGPFDAGAGLHVNARQFAQK